MSLSKPCTTVTSQLSNQLSMDTEPLTPEALQQSFSYVSADALAGSEESSRTSTQELKEEARKAERRPGNLYIPGKLSADYSCKSGSGPRDELEQVGSEIVARVYEMAPRKGEDSNYCSMSSGDSCSSMPSVDWQVNLKVYEDKMPPNIKMGYIDVLILYCEEDREGAEEFRQHLVTEIKVQNGPIVTLLYDAPEMEALCGSKIQHLATGVERSTYVFIYMTKNFVEDKWCEFSSESCLMEAITNPLKQWCVVPVYTEKRNVSFRVPMGLNTLKGINYYNNDRFYRSGVARLIGDKIYVRDRANEEHKIKQKIWLEEYKRKDIELREKQRRIEKFEEAKTQQLLNWLDNETRRLIKEGMLPGSLSHSASESDISSNPPSLAHSSSTSSLKPVQPQNAAVAAYFQLLLDQQLTCGRNQANYSWEQMQMIEQTYGNASPGFQNQTSPMMQLYPSQGQMAPGQGQMAPGQGQMIYFPVPFPPVSSSASYEQQFHHQVKRSTSRASADMGPSTPVQPGDRPVTVTPESMETQQQYVPHANQAQVAAQEQQGEWSTNFSDTPTNTRSEHQHSGSIRHLVPAFDDMYNSRTMSTNSSSGISSGSSNQSSRSLESNESNSLGSRLTSAGPERLGNTLDGNRSHAGNLPNCSLLEQDAGSSYQSHSVPLERRPADRTQHRVRAAADKGQSEDSDSDEVRSSGEVRKKKKEKKCSTHVVKHITYNIYQAGAVQIGDQNVVHQGDEVVPEENSDGEDVRGATAVVDKKNTSIDEVSHRMKNVDIKPGSETHGEMLPYQPDNTGASSAYSADAGPSTHEPVVQALKLAEPPVPVQPGTKEKPVFDTVKMLASIPMMPKYEASDDEKHEDNIEIEETVPANKINFKNIYETIEQSKTSKFEDNLSSSRASVKPSSGGQKVILPVKPILQTSSRTQNKSSGKARPVAAVPPQRHKHVDDYDDNCENTDPKTIVMSGETARKNVPSAEYNSSEQTFVKQAWCPETQANEDAEHLQGNVAAKDLTKTAQFDKCDSKDKDKFPISMHSDLHQLFFNKDRPLLMHDERESNVDDGLNSMESSYSVNLPELQEVVLGDDPLSRVTNVAETPTSRSFIPQSSPFTTTAAASGSDLAFDMLESGNFDEAAYRDENSDTFVESGTILNRSWNKKGSPPGKKESKECVIS